MKRETKSASELWEEVEGKKAEGKIESDELERFSVYRFSIDYPPVCRFEFNPKTRRAKRRHSHTFSRQAESIPITASLVVVTKKFQSAGEFATHSIKSMGKSRNVGKTDKMAEEKLTINSHEAFYNMVRFYETPMGFFSKGKGVPRVTCSVHLFCKQSSRYFVIYALLTPTAPEDFDKLFLTMVKSFHCH